MRLYSEEGTSLIVLLISVLTIFVLDFSLTPTLFVLITSFFALSYLIWYRRSYLEKPVDSLIGLIPGHYLILFALTLDDSVGLHIYLIWSLLIFTTLGYDLLNNRSGGGRVVKLTMMILYCIIWGVIVFLFQNLLIYGLNLENLTALGVRLGLSIGGLAWIGLGMIRISRSFIERRS
ncbi:MAG: hypothetical protein ACOC6I_02950 [Candidatus Bipolaricaulota bacterium]